MTGWDLGGGGGNSFPFENVNDFVRGVVIDLAEQQQTNIDTREPMFWDAEHRQPMMMSVVTLQTELRDPNNPSDDGKRTVFLKGSKKSEDQTTMSAVLDAVRTATGTTELKYGGELVIQFVGERKAKGNASFKAKCYKAWYTPPKMELNQPEADRQAGRQMAQAAAQEPPYSSYQNPPAGYSQQQNQQQGPPPYASNTATADPRQNAATGQAGGPPAGPPSGAGTQAPPWDAGAGAPPAWAQQEPPADPWSSGGQSVVGAPPQNDPWATPGEQSQPPVQTQQGPPPAGPPAAGGAPVTQTQVEAIKAAGVDPATVFGADYLSRVIPG